MTPIFQRLKLSAKDVQEISNETFAYHQGNFAKQNQEWVDSFRKDPEFGGLNYGLSVGYIQKALGVFSTPEERAALEREGYGNRLELVKAWARVGRAMASDKSFSGAPSSAEPVPTQTKLYGGKDFVGDRK
jgi:hypothetical protein